MAKLSSRRTRARAAVAAVKRASSSRLRSASSAVLRSSSSLTRLRRRQSSVAPLRQHQQHEQQQQQQQQQLQPHAGRRSERLTSTAVTVNKGDATTSACAHQDDVHRGHSHRQRRLHQDADIACHPDHCHHQHHPHHRRHHLSTPHPLCPAGVRPLPTNPSWLSDDVQRAGHGHGVSSRVSGSGSGAAHKPIRAPGTVPSRGGGGRRAGRLHG